MAVRREEYRKKRINRMNWGRLVRVARPGIGNVPEKLKRFPILEEMEIVPKPRLQLRQG